MRTYARAHLRVGERGEMGQECFGAETYFRSFRAIPVDVFLSKSHSFGYQYLEEATGILKQMGDTLSATPKFDDMVALLKHEQLDDDHCGAQFDLADDKKKN